MKLQENRETFRNLEAEIWVVSNDTPEKLEALRQKEGLSFPLLLDRDLAITARYGLLNEKGTLPDPTALVIAPDGEIVYLRVDENVVDRPEPSELAEALKKALAG